MAKDLYYRVSINAVGVGYDLAQDLTSLTIEEDDSKADQLTVNLSDPFKVFSHAFQEGMEAEVDLGTVDDHSLLFRGRIYKVDSNFPESGVPTLTLHAHDNSMKMGLRRRNRVWTDMTLEQIVKHITTIDHGFLQAEVKLSGNPKFTGNGIRQQNETDLAFLLRLASEYGCQMYVSANEIGDSLHFIAQYVIMTREPDVILYHGRCDVPGRLLSFRPTSDVSTIQLPRVFSGIEYESGQPVEMQTAQVEEVAKKADPFFDENMAEFGKRHPLKAAQLSVLIQASTAVQSKIRQELGGVERETIQGFTTAEHLSQCAKNQFSTSILGMCASGTTPGNKNIHAQTSIRIADVGGRFSGTWYLSSVRHILNSHGYLTEFECQR